MKFDIKLWTTTSATLWVIYNGHRNKFKMATAAILKDVWKAIMCRICTKFGAWYARYSVNYF